MGCMEPILQIQWRWVPAALILCAGAWYERGFWTALGCVLAGIAVAMLFGWLEHRRRKRNAPEWKLNDPL